MSAVRLFQDFQRLFGFCPCCREPFRLSDAMLFQRSVPPRTAWDELEDERNAVSRARERLDTDRAKLKAKATEQGQKERDRRLRNLTGFFRKSRIEVKDLKLIFHPVDYVSFVGLSKETCTRVELIDREPDSRQRERLQKSLEGTIQAGNVTWSTVRIDDSGAISAS